jgi:hypothetical protein
MLSQDDVKHWATDEVYARYHMLLLRSLLRSEEGQGGLFVWCQNPACFSGQIHPEQAEQPKVVCVQCGHATCFNHSMPWHEGKTCKQYDRTLPVKDTINRCGFLFPRVGAADIDAQNQGRLESGNLVEYKEVPWMWTAHP